LTDFGFPEWVLLDPDVQAHTAHGSLHLDAAWGLHPPRPFPVPSYASPAFYKAVGHWFDVVCPIIARHLAPAGCIVAVQSDNENSYLFLDQPYATDYSAASITAYRQFLSERYGTIEHLNALYQQDYEGFSAIEPPHDCQIRSAVDVPWHRDWVEYKERYIHQSLVQIAQMMRERGVQGVPMFHDVAFDHFTPIDFARMESKTALDWVGLNLYRSPQEYPGVRRRMRYLAGTTRLPFVPEFGSGIWSHHPQTPTPAEQEFVTLAALMYGMRAVNFYMLVERERWQGSPITRHGMYRPGYADFYHHLSTFLQKYPLGTLNRQPQALVLHNYDLGRYQAMASTLHYAHVDLLKLPEELGMLDLDLGFRWDVTHEANHRRSDNWLGQVFSQLQQRQLDYDISDSHIDSQRLRRYPIAFLPAADFMDVADQQRLLGYVSEGGCLIIGPGVPYLDSNLQPGNILGKLIQEPGVVDVDCGHIIWTPTSALADVMAQHLPAPTIQWNTPAVDVVEQVGESQQLLFIANPSDHDQEVTITFDTERRLVPVWGASSPASRASQMTLDLDPYTIQIWEAARD
jgi:beta-galactosidase